MRARKGKRTAGSYGDICALDPIGEPLLNLFTIELKRGQYVKHPGDLLDCSGSMDCHPFLKAVRQARDAQKRAGSAFWMLIVRRDFKPTTVFFPVRAVHDDAPLHHARVVLLSAPVFRYRVFGLDFLGLTLDKFLTAVDPSALASFVSAP